MAGNRVEIEDSGAVVFDRRIVGQFDFDTQTLILNAAWCRLAGLGFRIDGDAITDRRKVLLDRSNPNLTKSDSAVKDSHPTLMDPAEEEAVEDSYRRDPVPSNMDF